MTRDQVIEYIQHASPSDILQILDAMIEPVSSYLGCADGLENTKHDLLLQIMADEAQKNGEYDGR